VGAYWRRILAYINSRECRYCITALALVSVSLTIGLSAGSAFDKGCGPVTEAPFGCVEYFLNRYQTLLTGAFAIAGAVLLWVQISDQRQATHELRRQRQVSARIRMPHALSKLSAYWDKCFKAWLEENMDQKPTEPPHDALEVLIAAAAEADTETFRSIQELLILSQAFEARIRPHRYLGKRQRFNLMIVDIARLTYLTNRLYDYGRLKVDQVRYEKPSRATLTKELGQHTKRENERKIFSRIEDAMDSQFGRRNRDAIDHQSDVL